MSTPSHETQQALADPFLVAYDFETLALGERGAVVGISAASFGEPSGPAPLFTAWPIACPFPSYALKRVESGDLRPAELTELCPQGGREVDPDTVAWHREQPTWPTTLRALKGEGPRLVEALLGLLEAVEGAAAGRPVLWHSRPGAFDGAILLHLARQFRSFAAPELALSGGVPLHRRVRCLRTLQAAVCWVRDVAWRESERPHDPESDVAADAASADECARVLRGAGAGA